MLFFRRIKPSHPIICMPYDILDAHFCLFRYRVSNGLSACLDLLTKITQTRGAIRSLESRCIAWLRVNEVLQELQMIILLLGNDLYLRL